MPNLTDNVEACRLVTVWVLQILIDYCYPLHMHQAHGERRVASMKGLNAVAL